MASSSKKLAQAVLAQTAPGGIRDALQHTIYEYELRFIPDENQEDLLEVAIQSCAPDMITMVVTLRGQRRVGIFLHNKLEPTPHQIFELGVKVQRTIDKFIADNGSTD